MALANENTIDLFDQRVYKNEEDCSSVIAELISILLVEFLQHKDEDYLKLVIQLFQKGDLKVMMKNFVN